MSQESVTRENSQKFKFSYKGPCDKNENYLKLRRHTSHIARIMERFVACNFHIF